MKYPVVVIIAFVQILAVSCLSTAATPVKNVILMIPDGTSTSVLSLARWCQWYKDRSKTALAIDPYIRGLVKSHSSNAPIGDSGPTSSWYSTGEPSQTGFIAMYPPKDGVADLVEIDPTRAYQPLLTVLEGARLMGKKTGLVFTCQFPHATPADFAAHWYDRQEHDVLAKQMAHNGIDLLFGGGTKYYTNDIRATLAAQGYTVLRDDIVGFRRLDGKNSGRIWVLFGESDLPFDLDRNPAKTPSLTEMTGTALRLLSKSEKGFFLMVEGSKIDWAAHVNDPVGIYSEFLAFDRAVDTAIQFARADSHTVVVVCPDHGNSAVSIGNRFSDEGYDKLTIRQICEPIVRCKNTAEGLASSLIKGFSTDTAFIPSRFKQCNPAIIPSYPEIATITKACYKYRRSKDKDKDLLVKSVAEIITSKSFIGFTTQGHTGENVFFAAYDPRGSAPTGLLTGGEVNRYLCEALGLTGKNGKSSLKDSTTCYFHRCEVAMNDLYLRINRDTIALWNPDSLKFLRKKADPCDTALPGIADNDIVMKIQKRGATYTIPAYKNYYYVNAEQKLLKSVTVWVDKNRAFYLPKTLAEEIR